MKLTFGAAAVAALALCCVSSPVAAAKKQATDREPPPVAESWTSRIALADVGSAIMILAGIAMAFTQLRGIVWLRVGGTPRLV